MTNHEGPPLTCQVDGCGATHKHNSKWDGIAASTEGWYVQFDGQQWCPNHRPAWAGPLPGERKAARRDLQERVARRKSKQEESK